MKVNNIKTIAVHFTPEEIQCILSDWLRTEHTESDIPPDGSKFSLDKTGASFHWTERKEALDKLQKKADT